MKQKILNALKTEYANLGLSEKALNGVASFLEKTITDEGGIDAAIKEASVKGLLQIYQSELDSERGKASKAVKDFEDYKKAHPSEDPEPPKPNEPNNEVLTLLKQIQDDNNALKARLDAKEKEVSDANVINAVKAALRGSRRTNEKVIDLALKGVAVSDGDTVESLTEKYQGEYDSLYKDLYGDGVMPNMGGFHREEGYKKGKFAGVVGSLQDSGVLDKPSE